MLAVLRDADEPVEGVTLRASWPDPVQRDRALRSLVSDGLVVSCGDDLFELPR
jgi:A/G-specific adenine glycosylase